MTTKQNHADFEIHDLLRKRWSPRAFSDKKVEKETLCTLFEAARWAPSCFNEQPWTFLLASKDEPETYNRFLNCLVEGNQGWAESAPVLMFSVARLTFTRNDKPNRHAFHDVGLAVENLVLQAAAMELYVHQMGGFHLDKTRSELHIPETHEPVAALALGYLGSPDSLPDALKEREFEPVPRKALSDFVFQGDWEQPFLSS